MPEATSLVWACIDNFLGGSCEAAERNLMELQEGLHRVVEDENNSSSEVRTAKGRVSSARSEVAVSRWDRVSLLCARLPVLLRNGTLRWDLD
jgi:hypothetical protein